MKKQVVVVGMSGGVDSSVSALLLKQQGYEVIGLFMKNWEETNQDGICNATRDYEDVARVCEQIGIPYYSVNFTAEYQESVFAQFVADYRSGLTPNPDVLCNREIKFKKFLDKAMALGADFLATGHYCRLDGEGRLLRGVDPDKDQTYFLHAVPKEAFARVLFPIGHLPKKEVREIARKHGIATSEKKDSTGICFIGKRDFRPFLAQYIHATPGPFQTLDGKTVGRHEGASFYTLGQRKGMGLGGEGEAWYVVGKDTQKNIVFVERGASHPALWKRELVMKDASWIAPPLERCTAKVRYRQKDSPCTLLEGGRVVFDEPQWAVTPGQSVVFYDGDICLGGGVIL